MRERLRNLIIFGCVVLACFAISVFLVLALSPALRWPKVAPGTQLTPNELVIVIASLRRIGDCYSREDLSLAEAVDCVHRPLDMKEA